LIAALRFAVNGDGDPFFRASRVDLSKAPDFRPKPLGA